MKFKYISKLTEEFKNLKWKQDLFSVNTKFKIIRFDMDMVCK